jgi:hypothetical protein
MPDFTDTDVFAGYLSSFWTQMFQEASLARGVIDGFSLQLAQHYQDFAEAVNAVSIRDIPPFHTELIYPIVLRESEFSTGPKVLTFGSGGVFGPQPDGGKYREGDVLRHGERADLAPTFYADLPDNVVGTGNLILNRLYEPSVVLVAGADFVFEDGVIVFRENVFNNDLIAKRTIAGSNGSIDREMVLWATNVQIENFELYRQYGHLFFSRAVGGEVAQKALEAIFRLHSAGPSVARLDSFFAAASGFPVSAENSEKVVSIDRIGDTQVVITDTGVYRIPSNLTLRSSVKAGATLKAGSPLTTATEVYDRFARPLWWTDLDALTIDRSLMVTEASVLGFINQDVEVTLDGTVTVDGASRQLCRFYLAGSEKNVESFWKKTQERSIETDEFLAETLWVGAGKVDGDGDPDYDQQLFVNPLRILNDLIGDNLIIVKVNEPIQGTLSSSLRLLRNTMPAYCAIIVLLNMDVEDDYSVVSSSDLAVNPDSLSFIDPRAHFTNDIDSFGGTTQQHWENTDPDTGEFLTPTAEALSSSFSPDILEDTIDLGDSATIAENVTARLEPNC